MAKIQKATGLNSYCNGISGPELPSESCFQTRPERIYSFDSPDSIHKDTATYQQVIVQIRTLHGTSQTSMDCQTQLWSGPMEEHVT